MLRMTGLATRPQARASKGAWSRTASEIETARWVARAPIARFSPSTRMSARPSTDVRLTSTSGCTIRIFISGTTTVPPAMTRAASPWVDRASNASSTDLASTYSNGLRFTARLRATRGRSRPASVRWGPPVLGPGAFPARLTQRLQHALGAQREPPHLHAGGVEDGVADGRRDGRHAGLAHAARTVGPVLVSRLHHQVLHLRQVDRGGDLVVEKGRIQHPPLLEHHLFHD